jgi:hypothetical protein
MGNLELEGVYFIVFNFHSKHPGRMTWAFSTPMTLLRQEVTNETELELMQEIFDSSDSRHLKPFHPPRLLISQTKLCRFMAEVEAAGLE